MITSFQEFINESKGTNKSAITFNLNTTGRKDWDTDLKKYKGDFKQSIQYMSPDEFLNRVNFKRFTIDSVKVKDYVESFKKGAKNVPTPTMWFQNQYQYGKGLSPAFHDGSHRALALKEIGIENIPVKIII